MKRGQHSIFYMKSFDDWCPTLNGKSLNLFQIFCDYFPCVIFLRVFDEFYFDSLLFRPLVFILIKPPILFAAIRTPHFKTPICHHSKNHLIYISGWSKFTNWRELIPRNFVTAVKLSFENSCSSRENQLAAPHPATGGRSRVCGFPPCSHLRLTSDRPPTTPTPIRQTPRSLPLQKQPPLHLGPYH